MIALLIVVSVSATGCFVHRHTVGNGPQGKQPKSQLVKLGSKKALYLFGGLISLSQPDISSFTKAYEDYQIKTSYNVLDSFVAGLTGGLFSMRTVKVYVWRDDWNKMRGQQKKGSVPAPTSTPAN